MAMGMSYDDYWNGDPSMHRFYRQAEKIRRQQKNEELWLQGMYIYDALLDVSPLLHAYAKNGTKARPYPKEPYSITKEDQKRKEEQQQMRVAEKTREKLQAMMIGGAKNGRSKQHHGD